MADIAKLRELLEKATPGHFTVGKGINVMAADGYSATSVQSNLFDSSTRNEANAALLVAAANALPELLAIAEGAEADRADARRYRWLRSASEAATDAMFRVYADGEDVCLRRDTELDAAIDAALAGAVTQGEDHGSV